MKKIEIEIVIPEIQTLKEDRAEYKSNYEFEYIPIIGDTIIVEDFIDDKNFSEIFQNHPVEYNQCNEFIIYKREFIKGGEYLNIILYCKTAELYFALNEKNRNEHFDLEKTKKYISD
jgi:hypothetical protein